MAWLRIDDQFASHPKLLKAGPFATVLQIRALCYASQYLTDGFLPSEAVDMLCTDLPVKPESWGTYMVSVELWELNEGGFKIHDYLVYNPTREYVLKRKQQLIASGQAGGLARAQANAKHELKPSLELSYASPSPSPMKEIKKEREPVDNSIYPPLRGLITRRCSICSYYRAPYTGADGQPRCRDHQDLNRENKT